MAEEKSFLQDANKFEKNTNYYSLLLKQYEIYVESTDRFTAYRNQANTFFLTLNTAFVGFISAIIEGSDQSTLPSWIVFMCIAGAILCVAWYFLVRSYRMLNSSRFKVIHELENELPAKIYKLEWDILKSSEPKHIPQTYIEQIVPIAFTILYAIIVVVLSNP